MNTDPDTVDFLNLILADVNRDCTAAWQNLNLLRERLYAYADGGDCDDPRALVREYILAVARRHRLEQQAQRHRHDTEEHWVHRTDLLTLPPEPDES